MARSRGFTLVEVMIALVTFGIGITGALRLWLALAESAGTGRRWTAMATAAATEIERIEAAYRVGAPACVVPPSGSRFTPDGIGLSWTTISLGGQVDIQLEVTAARARRILIDTILTRMPCR